MQRASSPASRRRSPTSRRRADRHDLRLRRPHARAGLHLHVPVAAHPGRDARRELADGHLQRLARRAALAARQEGGSRWPERRRLRRLQRLRGGLPDGHRHPRRPAARMHHLRAVHRRLRRGDGQGRQAARPDLLRHAQRLQFEHGAGDRRGAHAIAPSAVRGADGKLAAAVEHFHLAKISACAPISISPRGSRWESR